MSKLDWSKAQRRRERQRTKRKRASKAVHPNSTAATVWGRKRWETSG